MFNSMIQNDIRQTLEHFRQSVDQLFESSVGGSTNAPQGGQRGREWVFSPAVESAWTDNALHLRAVLPGVPESDVRVNVQGNQLMIEGERRRPEQFGNSAWTQLTYGRFQTALNLPNGLDLERVQCRLHDGVLDVEIPVAEAMKPRQIRIETSPERKAING